MKKKVTGKTIMLLVAAVVLMMSGCGKNASSQEAEESAQQSSDVKKVKTIEKRGKNDQSDDVEDAVEEEALQEEVSPGESIDLMETDILAGTYWQGVYYEEFFSADLDGAKRTILPRNGFNYELYLNEDGTATFTDYDRNGTEDNHFDGVWERDDAGNVVLIPEREDGQNWMEQEYTFYPRGRELQIDWAGAYRIHLVEKSDRTRVKNALLKDRLLGTYMVVQDEEPDSYEIANVYYENGILMIESQYETKDDREVWSFWAEEFWPDDDALTSAVDSVQGNMGEFSVMASPRYGTISNDVIIEATEDGFTVTKPVDDFNTTTKIYQAIESTDSNRCHASMEELSERLPDDITRPSDLVGNYGAEGSKSALRITLRKDGSVTMIQRNERSEDGPIAWLEGVWGVNKDGNLVFVGEQIGHGTAPVELELSMDEMWEKLVLMDVGHDAPLTSLSQVAVDKIPEDEPMPRTLIREWHQVVKTSRMEMGDFENEYGELILYWYEIPKINEDTPGAKAINKKIDQKYGKLMDDSMKAISGKGEIGTNEISYLSGKYEDIYTVVVHYTEWYSDTQEYDSYYYDQSSGKELSASEFIQRLGLTKEQFLAAVKKEAEEAYKARYQDLTAAQREELYYEETLENMGEYINMTLVKPYISENGNLVAVTPVASLVGPAWTYTGVVIDYE